MFKPDDDWVEKMTEYFIKQILDCWIEKYHINWDIAPSTIFLAWAPWSWKTEFIETVVDNNRFIVIDIDKYRVLFDWYDWLNASIFQQYSTKVANKIYKFCMKNKLNIIVDWTFWNLNVIKQNIQQCIKNKRDFWVVLIYQDPLISYFYTKLRQIEWKRNVPKDVFIDKFFKSIENSFKIKEEYNDMFFIFAYKNSNWIFQTKTNVIDKKSFDKKVWKSYNLEELEKELYYIDNIFESSNKVFNFIRPLFNFIMRWLWQKKKEK